MDVANCLQGPNFFECVGNLWAQNIEYNYQYKLTACQEKCRILSKTLMFQIMVGLTALLRIYQMRGVQT